jgi:hypothetical protein
MNRSEASAAMAVEVAMAVEEAAMAVEVAMAVEEAAMAVEVAMATEEVVIEAQKNNNNSIPNSYLLIF